MNDRILVRRIGALGDVILTTPVIKQLRKANPDSDIAVQTAYPEVFANSPHRISIFPPGPLPFPWTKEGGLGQLIDLTLAYEKRPSMHIVEGYIRELLGDIPENLIEEALLESRDNGYGLRQELFYKPVPPFTGNAPVVAVHAAKAGWRNRTLPESTWLAVIDGLRKKGYFPLLVGTARDALPAARTASFHSISLMAQTALIANAACFIGSDSGLLHAAGATDTPIVGVFTCAQAYTRIPIRKAPVTVIEPDLNCIGCLARAPIPTTQETCERGDVACVKAVSAEAIIEAAHDLIRGA